MDSSDPAPTPTPNAATPETNIQVSPDISAPAESPSIPLPPLPRQPVMSPEASAALRGWLDFSLAALVLGFAFLVASFPVLNPDFFRQAAVGRLLAQGNYHFGVDPFTFSGDQVYWVNHSWLFGLLVYGLYQIPAIGGTVVVVFKALLAVVLAAILLHISRRRGQSTWVPAICTVLAILTASPRMFLQPSCLSFVFLALTLWLLSAFHPEDETPDGGKRIWWLAPLFALWANCDAWFLVGPLAVGLYLIGALIEWKFPPAGIVAEVPRGRSLRTLALVFVAGLAACLLNPHHVRVFTLPVELGLAPAEEVIYRDPQFRSLYLSPLNGLYYTPRYGWNVAGMAYFPLLLVSAASFIFVFGRAAWWRLSVWLGFTLLSLYSVRCIPFFAIVAGPIAALNWLDFAQRRLARSALSSQSIADSIAIARGGWWSLTGRILSVVLLLALLIASVPGWLQAQPYERHRLGWNVVADPSLRAAAEQIRDWRQQDLLPAEPNWFSMRQEVGDYLAWFAPGERVFLDQNLPQFPAAAGEYLELRAGLEKEARNRENPQEETRDDSTAKRKWKKVLRNRRVRFWILDNILFGSLSTQKAEQEAQRMLLSDPDEWVLCAVRGRVAIFAWRDPEARGEPDPAHGLELDLKRLAFGREAEQAPPKGPKVAERQRDLWSRWVRAEPTAAMGRQAAGLYELRFQTAERRKRMQEIQAHTADWRAIVVAGAIGSAVSRGPMPGSLLALSWTSSYHDLFPPRAVQPVREPRPSEQPALAVLALYINSAEVTPPPSLYLALRASRRGLLDNAQDSQAYLLMGQTYVQLDSQPYERLVKAASPLAADVRRTQIVAAYANCLRFQPQPLLAADAHMALFELFSRRRFLDVATYHLRESLKNRRMLKAEDLNVTAAQFTQELEAMSRELKRREEEVKREQDRYEVNAANKAGLEKVAIALEKGLIETALTALDQVAADELSGRKQEIIVRAVMAVLLDLGRLDKARELLLPDPETADQPVAPEYLPLRLRLAAARGDYEQADRLLADALDYAWKDPNGFPMHARERTMTIGSVARALMGEAQHITGVPRLPLPFSDYPADYWVRRWRLDALESGTGIAQQRAEWQLLRGWLALESGRCVEARASFRAVRSTVVPPSYWVPEVNKLDLFSPGIHAQEIQLLQELASRQNATLNVTKQYLSWLEEAQP